MHADESGLRESNAYRMLSWRHPHDRLGVFAVIAEIDGEPARAWVECHQCADVFEFVGYEGWRRAEAVERTEADGSGGAAVGVVVH